MSGMGLTLAARNHEGILRGAVREADGVCAAAAEAAEKKLEKELGQKLQTSPANLRTLK